MATPLKHSLGRVAVERLGTNVQRAWGDFPRGEFVSASMVGLEKLELKQRVIHVGDILRACLPKSYSDALKVIVDSSGEWDRGSAEEPNRGFAAWPLYHVVERYGADDFRRSMSALRSITHLFSAEFAIRVFIARYPKQAFAELSRWTEDENEHVRRLVSEGIRPRLPWATQIPSLIENPGPILSLLEKLKDDPSLYVRRSVANNLNDIAKDHPELVVDLCQRWSKSASDERQWVITRATRTLVKDGHPRVWGLLGFTVKPKVKTSEVTLSNSRPCIGESLVFDFEIESTARVVQVLAIDYVVHFTKSNGKTRPKVFKLKVANLKPGQSMLLSKQYSFRQRTTRTHYPGTHAIEVLINGEVVSRREFELDAAY